MVRFDASIQGGGSSLIVSDQGVVLTQFEVVANVHQRVLVRLQITIVRNIGDPKAFASPLLYDEQIKIITIGCDVYARGFAALDDK